MAALVPWPVVADEVASRTPTGFAKRPRGLAFGYLRKKFEQARTAVASDLERFEFRGGSIRVTAELASEGIAWPPRHADHHARSGLAATARAAALKSSAILQAAFALRLAAVLQAQPDPLAHWTPLNPLPTGNRLNAVTCGGGLYIAVGEFGTLIASPDATNWISHGSGTSVDLHAVIRHWTGTGRFPWAARSVGPRDWMVDAARGHGTTVVGSAH